MMLGCMKWDMLGIVIIDLEDSGLAFWNDGKVKSVSIDGNDSFESINYFYPDDKVIIKYH